MRPLRTLAIFALMAALPAPGLPPRRDEVRPGPARNLPRIAEVATTIHAPGDVNGDTLVDVRDLFYLINFLFAHGPSPLGPADLNNDGRVDVADVLYLVNSLFAGGPAPIPDTQPPSIYYTDPYYGAPGVPRNVVGRMEFSEPMDPATLNADNIRLWDITRDLPVPCTVEAEPGGLVARVIPLEVLAGGRTYGFLPNFAALTDLAGNPVDPDNVYTDGLGRIPFTAGFTRDETPPAIVGSLFPEEGAADLPTNTAFMIRFSEVVGDIGLPSAFTVDGHPAELAIQYEIEKTARVRFAAPFAPNSAHTLVVNGLRDLAGNVMTDPWELHFTTGASPDTAPSTGTWNTPYGSVTRDFRPRLHFDKPVLPESLEIESSPAVAGEVVLDAARTTGMFIPRSSLPPQDVRFYAQAMDESGHVLFPYRLLVSVSLAPPVAISPPVVSPPDGSTDVPLNARIAIVGSADPTTWSAISLWSAGTPVPITVTWQVGDLVVIPSSPLSQGTTYTVETAGLVDTLGRPYPAVSSSFTTRLDSAPDLTPPSVVASVPADGATSVDPATPVIVTFSEPLAATGGSVLLTYTTGFGVAAWPGHLERKGTSVAYVPALPLPGGTTFTVTAAQLADLCGNTLAAGATFSFTTSGAVDTSPPAVTAVDVIPNGHWCGSVLLYFSKPIAPIATVPTGSCSPSLAVLYYDGYRAGAVPCSSLRTFGGLSLRIDCASPYGPSAVVLTSNITDRDGHPADPTLVFPFDAGTRPVYGAETTYRPEDGATGVSRTTPILIFASHDFDPDSLAGIVITADSNIIDGTLSSSDRTILFTPNAPLPGGSLVEVFVTSGLRLVDAAVLIPAYTSFRVAPSPSASAVVVAATPAEGEDVPTNARLRVRYSRALYAGSVSAGSVALTAAEVAVSGSASLEGGDTVVFTPANPLAGGVSHALSIEGLKDLDGGAAAPFTRQFTTGSGVVSSPPSVAVVTPPDESTLIGTNARMSLVFTRRPERHDRADRRPDQRARGPRPARPAPSARARNGPYVVGEQRRR